MRNVILNQSNIVPGSNNSKFRYAFPSTVQFHGDQLALANFSYNFSVQNVTAQNRNNSYSYVWYDSVGATTHDVVMPDGIYELDTINAYLQFTMFNNGHYLIDNNNLYIYYLSWSTNTTLYAFELQSDPIPSSLPSGWSNPAGITFPATPTTPQVVITANYPGAGGGVNLFPNLMGFDVGTYPPVVQSTAYYTIGGKEYPRLRLPAT